MTLLLARTSLDARIAAAATPGFPLVSRRRLRAAGVDRHVIAARLKRGQLHHLWTDMFMIGMHHAGDVPIDFIRRAAVATVEPHAGLGGVSAIERLTGWERFAGAILVVSDRAHANIDEHGIVFRQVDVERELVGASTVGGVPTTAPIPSLLHAARDLTAHQVANAMGELRYHTDLTLDGVQNELDARTRVIGAPRLRRGLELLGDGSAGTRSRSEDGMLPIVSHRYGEPLVNVRGAAGMPDYEPDMCWMRRAWILEIDGRHHLEDPVIRAADARRDALLRAAGWIVVRIPWWWVWHRRAHALRVIDRAFHP